MSDRTIKAEKDTVVLAKAFIFFVFGDCKQAKMVKFR